MNEHQKLSCGRETLIYVLGSFLRLVKYL